MLWADKFLTRLGVIAIITLLALPEIFSLLTRYEGYVFPVADKIIVSNEESFICGSSPVPCVRFTVKINKKRQCEFIGINWYSDLNKRLLVIYEEYDHYLPKTRALGEQVAGPWTLHGVSTVNGTRAETVHRCHPLWLTHTSIYP